MDLGSFLTEESGGSWADEEVDMSSIGVNVGSTAAPVGSMGGASGASGGEIESYQRREREEYPVPDAPPYKARVANLPYDATEAALTRFFEDRLQTTDCVLEVKLPVDNFTSRPKGFAFVTFSEKAILEEALNLSSSEFNGRKIYVNVAAPQKQDVFDLDWRASRTGPPGGGRREEPVLDWGAARSSGPVGGGDRPRRPRREEPDLDWSAARGAGPTGEDRPRRPRREEPELDWGAARGTFNAPPPRERRPRREEPELDWGSARGSSAQLPPRERSFRKPKQDDLDWGAARGSAVPKKREEKEFDWLRRSGGRSKPPASNKTEADAPQPQKSSYHVLAMDDDDEQEDEEKGEESKEAQPSQETGVEKQLEDVTLKTDEGWERVGK